MLVHVAICSCLPSELLHQCIFQCIDVNEKDEYGNTALHYAVCFNNLQAINWLLLRGANVLSVNAAGQLPVSVIADFCLYLVEKDAYQTIPYRHWIYAPDSMDAGSNEIASTMFHYFMKSLSVS